MNTKLNRRSGERGLIWLLIGFIVVLLIILGVIVYLIYKWSKMPPPSRGIDITYVTTTTSAATVREITGQDPPPAPTPSRSLASPTFQMAEPPDGMEAKYLAVERSTNLVDWAEIVKLDASVSEVTNVFQYDTNVVTDRAFYRTKTVYGYPNPPP